MIYNSVGLEMKKIDQFLVLLTFKKSLTVNRSALPLLTLLRTVRELIIVEKSEKIKLPSFSQEEQGLI